MPHGVANSFETCAGIVSADREHGDFTRARWHGAGAAK